MTTQIGGAAGEGTEQRERIRPGKHRRVQVARTGKRKLFGPKAQREFLEWLAATSNVKFSAELTGFANQTVYKHLMKDEAFRAGWRRALEQGYARLEMECLAEASGTEALSIDGDWEAERGKLDPVLAGVLLREHKRGLAGIPKRGAAPKVASNEEVRSALEKRLKAFRARVRGPGRRDGDAAAEE